MLASSPKPLAIEICDIFVRVAGRDRPGRCGAIDRCCRWSSCRWLGRGWVRLRAYRAVRAWYVLIRHALDLWLRLRRIAIVRNLADRADFHAAGSVSESFHLLVMGLVLIFPFALGRLNKFIRQGEGQVDAADLGIWIVRWHLVFVAAGHHALQ